MKTYPDIRGNQGRGKNRGGSVSGSNVKLCFGGHHVFCQLQRDLQELLEEIYAASEHSRCVEMQGGLRNRVSKMEGSLNPPGSNTSERRQDTHKSHVRTSGTI